MSNQRHTQEHPISDSYFESEDDLQAYMNKRCVHCDLNFVLDLGMNCISIYRTVLCFLGAGRRHGD